MDFRDFFRSVLGLRRNPRYDPNSSECDGFGYLNKEFNPGEGEDEDDHDNNEFSFFFGNNHGNLDDMFQHFHGDMFRQMESLHRQMDEMVKGFGTITSDHFNPFDNPRIKEKPNSDGKNDGRHNITWFFSPPSQEHEPKDPRNFMLKDKGSVSPKSGTTTPGLTPSNEPESFDFKGNFHFPPWTRPSPETKKDTDLDDKVSHGEVLDLIQRSNSTPQQQQQPTPGHHGFFSHGSSFSMTTIQGPDGRVEQKKVVRDSSGREKTTVTRSIGDQTHTVTTTADEQGRKEHQEDFKNMDETDVKKFEEKWRWSDSSKPIAPNAPAEPSLYIDSNDRNLFSRLFGGSW